MPEPILTGGLIVTGGIVLTGGNSEIIKSLIPLLPASCSYQLVDRAGCDMEHLADVDRWLKTFANATRIVLAHGAIVAAPFLDRSSKSLTASWMVNVLSTVRICEYVLASNPNARIVVIGSESAQKGSYDIAYWLAKAALHAYVRQRRLEHPGQQLVCVAPAAIAGTGMTATKNHDSVAQSIAAHPKKRLATTAEIAKMIYHLLFVDEGYTTNTVIEMNGGKFAGAAR